MAAKLAFQYDREADILHIRSRPPYAEQGTEELGGDVIARLNPTTGDVESLEVLFFSTRLLRSDHFELPVTADLHRARWVRPGRGMETSYVDLREGAYRVVGTRVSLDSIVYAFNSGHPPEAIAQSFPVLTLEQVYGSIAYYLGNRDEVDRYLEAREQDYQVKRAGARAADPVFYQKLADGKSRTPLAR